MYPPNDAFDSGFSIIELVVTLSLSAVMTGFAVLQFQEMMNPAQSSASAVGAFFKEARARAVSTTTAYRVQPTHSRQLVAYFGTNCSSTPTQDPRLILNLPEEVSLTNIAWDTCFSTRGLATNNIVAGLSDDQGQVRNVEVYLGGAVRIE